VTISKMVIPRRLPTRSWLAILWYPKGELFVLPVFGAVAVLLVANEPVVDLPAILVVAVVVLETLPLLLPLPLKSEDDDWLEVCVVVYVLPAEFFVVNVWIITPLASPLPALVYVDETVAVLPAESVVVIVLIAPGSVVVEVYTEPALFVPTMMTGIRHVYAAVLGSAVVTVDAEPAVWVTVTTVSPEAVAGPTGLGATLPAVSVTVTVVCIATLLANCSALLIADCDRGVPSASQASERGFRRALTSRLLSQAPCIHKTRSGRNLPIQIVSTNKYKIT
jgi:hypothetical protein